MNTEMCFYQPGSMTIVDTARADGLSSVYSHTLEQVRAEYPGAEYMPFQDACQATDKARADHYQLGVPEEITEEQYVYALEVLPPCRWSHGSFYVSELQIGDIADWYITTGNRFFHMYNRTNANKEAMSVACRTLAATVTP